MVRVRKQVHVTTLLQQLPWLPVRERIHYKILLLAWRVLLHGAGVAPTYLIQDILTPCVSTRYQRSGDECLPVVPWYLLTTYGRRTFSQCHSTPGLWNSIPSDPHRIDSLVSFKTNLKRISSKALLMF